MRLQSSRIELVLDSPTDALAKIESLSDAERAEVSPEFVSRMRTMTAGDPWATGFTIRLLEGGAAIGSCGFKGPPDTDSRVEIAYGINPEHRGQGFATEAARALIQFAATSRQVRTICAHTLPEGAGSAKVLTRCGFVCLGEVIDPVEGRVLCWERACPDPSDRSAG